MRRLHHLGLIVRDLTGHSFRNRSFWMLPLALLIGILMLAVVMGQAIAPITLYPLF